MIHDCWFEILVRVDPYFIFNCILVCKACFEVIVSPEFRQRYEKVWKSNSRPVGLIKNCYEFNLLATSELGRNMNANKSLKQPLSDFFISKSGEGDGLILSGNLLQKRLYVSMSESEIPIPLPIPPPAPPGFRRTAAAILSQHNSYMVLIILVKSGFPDEVMVQTLSSSSDKWEKYSKLALPEPYSDASYIRGPGMVSSSRGVVCWRGNSSGNYVFAYDAYNRCVRLFDEPMIPEYEDAFTYVNYGLSPRGYLQCAVSWVSNSGSKIDVWCIDDDEVYWERLHSVNLVFPKRLHFVSFVPGRSDCIFVKHGDELSLYNLLTRTFDIVVCCCFKESWIPSIDLIPLTMADLGVWPSSPFSKRTKVNISSIKHLFKHLFKHMDYDLHAFKRTEFTIVAPNSCSNIFYTSL